ncbi:flavoprotein [Micrococcus luteus]|uniref:flavoprotein n=1 Tax=Micrococcus luteus TaxID=1270 RepID=UPI0015D90D48|nr:flavoprotein [Micrococcus luteus]
MTPTTPDTLRRPSRLDLAHGRLLLVGSGAFAVHQLPQWCVLLRRWYGIQVRVCLTHSASRLVASDAIAAACGAPVEGPGWRTADGLVPHRQLAAWPDIVLVAPATAAFLAKLALGVGDSLALSVVLDTTAPIVVAPSLPDGTSRRAAVQRHLRTLDEDGYRLVPTTAGRSLADGSETVGALADLPTILRHVAVAAAQSGSEVR